MAYVYLKLTFSNLANNTSIVTLRGFKNNLMYVLE
jgi:hypothetical protein